MVLSPQTGSQGLFLRVQPAVGWGQDGAQGRASLPSDGVGSSPRHVWLYFPQTCNAGCPAISTALKTRLRAVSQSSLGCLEPKTKIRPPKGSPSNARGPAQRAAPQMSLRTRWA